MQFEGVNPVVSDKLGVRRLAGPGKHIQRIRSPPLSMTAPNSAARPAASGLRIALRFFVVFGTAGVFLLFGEPQRARVYNSF